MGKRLKRVAHTKSSIPRKPGSRSGAPQSDSRQVYAVFGKVMLPTGAPAAGLIVIAYDHDESSRETLGQATTRANGAYKISYAGDAFRRSAKERGGADVVVCVYDQHNELLFTSKKQNNAPAQYQLNVQLPAKQFVVQGRVKGIDDTLLPNVLVRVFDRDLRREEPLGSAKTDIDGRYQIAYSTTQFSRAEKAGADLVVRVLALDGKTLLAQSDTLFNASAQAEINLTVSSEQLHVDSEWERYQRELAPLIENLQPQDLTDEDLQFLHGETRIPLLHLQWLRYAYRWSVEHRQHRLPTEAFYAFLRQGLSPDWPQLLQTGPARWRAALKQAVAAKQVPASVSASSDVVVNKLQALAVEQTFSATTSASGTFTRPVGLLLSGTALTLQLQRQIAGLLLDRSPGEDPQQWWKKLADAGVPAQVVNATRFALEADALLSGHVPTLKILQADVAKSFGSAQELASLTRQQWQEVARKTAETGGLPNEFKTADAYAETLANQVEEVFPTQAVMYRLREAAQPIRREIGLFLSLNPQFDLLQSPINGALDKANLQGIKTPKVELAAQLRKEAAVARVVPHSRRAEHMALLLGKGYDSAAKIVLKGKGGFTRDIVPIAGARAAGEMYSKAKVRANAAVLAATGILNYLGPLIPVLPHAEPTGHLATWAELFGSGNGCHCPACGSAHGPAAYLVDLFEFLKEKDAKDPAGGASLLEVLFERRPDLRHVKLNCANAETPLPYIDLVIEHLERLAVTLNSRESAFPRLEYNESTTPQTRADMSVEQLRAEPDVRNALRDVYAASGVLQTATYPWQLPFDRTFERAGIDFELIGTSAAEVLELLGTGETALALVRSGLNHATWNLLHSVVATNQADVLAAWGARNWEEDLLKIGGANGLLKRSGLAATELYALIESQPWAGWRATIDRGDDPCDVDRHRIAQRAASGAGAAAFDEATRTKVFDLLHRALRLRLRMGWSTSTLLAVMRALGVDAEHPGFDMLAVSRLAALAQRLEITPELLAQRMVALHETAGEPASAANRSARRQWLALLQLSEEAHADLTVLGLPDSLAVIDGAERLRRLEQALRERDLLVESGIDPAELRYLLQHGDALPAVFAMPAAELERNLDQIVAGIHAADTDTAEPRPDAATLLVRRAAAAIQQLTEITGGALAAQVAADQRVSETETIPALVRVGTGSSAQAAVHAFVTLAATPSESLRAEARIILLRIIKTCRLLELLRCTAEDVTLLGKLYRTGIHWFDFNSLPANSDAAALSFEQFRGLLTVSLVQANLKDREPRLLTIMLEAPADSAQKLNTLTGWGKPLGADGAGALTTLAEALGLASADPNTWRSPDTYLRLRQAAQWLQRRRLSADDAQVLRDAAETGMNTPALAALIRRQFATEKDYFTALTPAMDRLRLRQRDALLEHILHTNTRNPKWQTADDVYAHLLIDVQMGPCQLTSRIVQAHSAVQLFVQRCLMNLEKPEDVALGNVSNIAEWRQWDWMKHYRVWEAARKVFLYPENWIEPDLRVGKSPFFETLENELLQDEITEETTEQALRNYLVQLHEVSNLDIRALFEEAYDELLADGKTASRRVIHMVGRTRGRPHVYFYRTRQDDLSWSPWEKIDLTIDSDHLTLAVHNQRPMLFWPQWKEVEHERDGSSSRLLEMTLHVSTREFGQWSAPSSSRDVLRLPLKRAALSLRSRFREGGMDILVYDYFTPSTRGLGAALGIEIASAGFSFDYCTGELRAIRLPAPILRLLPPFVEPDEQGLREAMDGIPAATRLRTGRVDEPERIISADVRALTELLDRGGLAGLLIAAFAVHSDELRTSFESALRDDQPGIDMFLGPVEGYRLIPSQQYGQFNAGQPYVFQYQGRQLLAIRKTNPVVTRLSGGFHLWLAPSRYVLELGEHPFLCDLLEAIRSNGLDGLYRQGEGAPSGLVVPTGGARRHPRQLTVRPENWIRGTLSPNPQIVAEPYPVDEFDFSSSGAYALYNWELFFHVPLMLAEQLRKNQRYDEARSWFHTIFDPTDVSPHPAPQKYWRVKPLFNDAANWDGAAESLETMLERLWAGRADVIEQVEQWRKDPFNPHALASRRLIAYMKTVVQKYVENLIEWGDSLFRRDTMESINEATQLYVLASHILGERPVELPEQTPDAKSYAELTAPDSVDRFGNVLIDIESGLPLSREGAAGSDELPPGPSMLYFCIPSNPRLRELQATVDDRLFKIRHCMDIDGRVRQLALFAPPIDPALLVRARAAGLDIGAALSMAFDVPRSQYRFQALLQKALEFTNEVRSFGGALLSALEKRDAEYMAQWRARHEVGLLKLVSDIKKQQVAEAEAQLETIRLSRAQVETRFEYYSSRDFMSAGEESQIGNLSAAQLLETVGQSLTLASSVAFGLPDVIIGPGGGTKYGGTHIGNALRAAGGVMSIIGSQATFAANLSAIMAGHERRNDEWKFQADLARKELAQIDKQIIAAEIRLAIAGREQRNHEQQITQAEEAERLLRDKFTNLQLYNWMSSQLSAMHYQAYRLAFTLAQQAQAAAKREVDTPDNMIGLDHWDTGRKGLLAGERLAQDLRRLELAYLERNTRELEVTKHVSLRQLNPLALMSLRSGGSCEFQIPEAVFDLDFPGHSFRRIKSVSISVPCIGGPYTSVSGMLTLNASRTRPMPNPSMGGPVPEHVADTLIPAKSIATSSAQNDNGLFEFTFHDERYLPFEGCGVESNWRFALPDKFRAFDYDTISDVVLHLRYTAREVADTAFATAVSDRLVGALNAIPADGLKLLVSVRHDYPAEWRALQAAGSDARREVRIDASLFPYFVRGNFNIAAVRSMTSGLMSEELPFSGPSSTATVALSGSMEYLLVSYRISEPAG